MKILSIDPSSSCCGFAILREDESLIDAGRMLPTRVKDPANERIRTMTKDLMELVVEHRPDCIVIEDTSGFVSKRHGAGGGRGLAVYGKALGYIICAMDRTGVKVHLVKENDWTRGKKKIERQRMCQWAYPKQYFPEKDPGGDVSDAIQLALWWLTNRREKAVA